MGFDTPGCTERNAKRMPSLSLFLAYMFLAFVVFNFIFIAYLGYKRSLTPIVIRHVQKDTVTVYNTTLGYMNRDGSSVRFIDPANKNKVIILSGDFIIEYPNGSD